MFQGDRSPEPTFEADERLFLRYGAEEFIDGQISSAAIHFPRSSVNRSRFSEPRDVLFDEDGKYADLGVIQFTVGDVPPEVRGTGQSQAISFFSVHHEPEELNYAHSEIWSRTEKDGVAIAPTRSVNVAFRIKLSQKAEIAITATRNRNG